MTSEHLLDAMGLLDDDLIQEAEVYRAQSRRAVHKGWLVLAAGFTLAAALGYGAGRLEMGGNSTASDFQNSGGASAPSGSPGGEASPDNLSPGDCDGSSITGGGGLPEPVYSVGLSLTGGEKRYIYQCRFDSAFDGSSPAAVPQTDELPQGCRSLGTVQALEENGDITLPHTDSGWFAGCSIWIQSEGWEGPVYLELPQGGYLIFEYSRVYDLVP